MEKYPISGFRTVEVVQEVERGFTLQLLNDIVAEWSSLKDYAYILHDKDETRPHIHLMMRFNCSVPTSAILKKFGGVVEFQHLEKCRSWKSAMAYLTHSNRPNKFQYDDADVFSNFDWKKDADDALNTDKAKLEALAEKIASGECRPYNVTDFVTDVFYTSYERKIEGLFKYKYKSLALQSKGDRNMKLMYIHGGSGVGKTTFAKEYCEKNGMSYYVSSGGKNPLDNYGGEDAIILDDLRPSDYKFNEFLKLTDNHTSSMVSCRYYNKSLVWCKLMIITSPLRVEEFYANMQDADGEQAKQLKRRFECVLHMTKEKVSYFFWSNKQDCHIFKFSHKNDTLERFKIDEDATVSDMLNSLQNMGVQVNPDFLVEAVTEVAKQVNIFDIPDDDLPF